MKAQLTQSDVNHLRRLLGWVRCEIGQSPEEMRAMLLRLAPSIQFIDDAGQARIIEQYQKTNAVPKYVRQAIKALELSLIRYDGGIIDADAVTADQKLLT